MEELSKLNNDYLHVFPEIRGISIFDTISYDYFDMEVLGPSQRLYLIDKAGKLGFRQSSGKWLEHENGTKIHFPGNKLFNRNFKSFLPDKLPENVWLALTPTQAAFMLLQENANEQELYQLMMSQPFNLRRLGIALEHEHSYERFVSLFPELKRLYERSQIQLKNKASLDKLR